MALPIDFHENFKEMVLPETTMPRDLGKTSIPLSSLFKLWPLSQTWVIILPFTQTFLCFITVCYSKFGNFRKGFIFAKLRIWEVS